MDEHLLDDIESWDRGAKLKVIFGTRSNTRRCGTEKIESRAYVNTRRRSETRRVNVRIVLR